jgi:integrase
MILLTFRHGLRAAEVCDLRWVQVDFNGAVLHVRRVKNDTPSTHPLLGDEMRALRRLQRESKPSPFVFVSERGSPFTTVGFARMIERAAAGAGRPRCFRDPSDRCCRHGHQAGAGRASRIGAGADDQAQKSENAYHPRRLQGWCKSTGAGRVTMHPAGTSKRGAPAH